MLIRFFKIEAMSLCQHNTHTINLLNVNHCENLPIPLYLLKGTISNPCSCAKIILTSDHTIEYSCSYCPNTGNFKVLLDGLTIDGQNHLTISYCSASVEFTLIYEPPVNVQFTVQVLYIVCKNHDGCFQSPSTENSVNDACARLTIGIKLIQTLYSDKLVEQGFGRKSFQVTSNCSPFYSELPVDDAKRMDQNSLWNHFAREVLTKDSGTLGCKKFIGFIGCTEYLGIFDGNYTHANIKSKTVANAALGGGDFALFGTGCLYTWPATIRDVMKCFESTEAVDAMNYLDDSNSRRTFGGCFATTLGSVCHEVGHIFDLGHNENGIMGNGFDFVNRFFTVCNHTEVLPNRITGERPTKSDKSNDPRLTKLKQSNKFLDLFHHQKGKDLTFFERNAAITLAYHKWFNQFSDNETGDILCMNNGGDRVIVSRKYPIRLVEFRETNDAMMISYFEFMDKCVLEFTIPERITERGCVVFVMDDVGNIFKF